jgi:hypothetical protein
MSTQILSEDVKGGAQLGDIDADGKVEEGVIAWPGVNRLKMGSSSRPL